MKKFLSVIFSLLLVVAVLPQFASAKEDTEQPLIKTPQDYIDYLRGSNIDKRMFVTASNNSADEILEDFTSLSPADQQKFVDYLNDPKVAEAFIQALETGENTILYNGDVSFSFEDEDPGITTMAAVRKVAVDSTTTILGIDIIKTQVYVQYRVAGTSNANLKVTEILNGGGIVIKNWYPTINITVKDDKPYISSDSKRAYQTSYFTWNFVHKALGLTYGTATQSIWGFTDGSKGSSFSKS